MTFSLEEILKVQEHDIKMLRLMTLKVSRLKELAQIEALRKELHQQLTEKQEEIKELSRSISSQEQIILDIKEKIRKLEAKQSSVKKVDEFNAITQEMTSLERERISTEQIASDMIDKRSLEEELLEKIRSSLEESDSSSQALEQEIEGAIRAINKEGSHLKEERTMLASKAPTDLLKVYERLLENKKDRVVVPLENRTCSGCHITLTAQHENLVRRGERLIFCEHCSRIHYWIHPEVIEGPAASRRRRKKTS
jgi:hypothetical protein